MTTVPGRRYVFSFWSGNVVYPAGGWGTTSTVKVRLDGTEIYTAVNDSGGAGQTSLAWKRYCTFFTAIGTSTQVALVNADPSGDNSNIIDDVSLR